MHKDAVSEVAVMLREVYRTRVPCAPIRGLLPDRSSATAYAVQQLNTDYWTGRGRRLAGCKIGLTSSAVQRQLGVDQPDFGRLFEDMCRREDEAIDIGELIQPKIEAEVAFRLGKDLPGGDHTAAGIAGAIDHAIPALEIVDSRISRWQITLADTIADNASSGLYVLGRARRRLDEFEPASCEMVLRRNGQPVSRGAGADCLGNPLQAAAWLANKMFEMGHPLKAGDIILSGALGPMVEVCAGDAFEAHISGLGSVTARFSEREQ